MPDTHRGIHIQEVALKWLRRRESLIPGSQTIETTLLASELLYTLDDTAPQNPANDMLQASIYIMLCAVMTRTHNDMRGQYAKRQLYETFNCIAEILDDPDFNENVFRTVRK